jgi:hypothetical protein
MVKRVALIIAASLVARAAIADIAAVDAVTLGPAAPATAGHSPVLEVEPADYGMTIEAAVGTHVMARLGGIVTFYFDRARLSGPAVKNMYVSGGPGSYVVWFRVTSGGEANVHLPFFSVDEHTKAIGGLDLTVKAAPGKTAAEPTWVELPTSSTQNAVDVEVAAGSTVFIAWPLARTADVLNGVEVAGASVEKLMDPRWMHALGEHEGEWLVTMVEATSPGTAAIKFGNGKVVTIRVKKAAAVAAPPAIDKTI